MTVILLRFSLETLWFVRSAFSATDSSAQQITTSKPHRRLNLTILRFSYVAPYVYAFDQVTIYAGLSNEHLYVFSFVLFFWLDLLFTDYAQAPTIMTHELTAAPSVYVFESIRRQVARSKAIFFLILVTTRIAPHCFHYKEFGYTQGDWHRFYNKK